MKKPTLGFKHIKGLALPFVYIDDQAGEELEEGKEEARQPERPLKKKGRDDETI